LLARLHPLRTTDRHRRTDDNRTRSSAVT